MANQEQESPRVEHVIPDEECLPEYLSEWTYEDELRAQYARARADAWARSPNGTPYGSLRGGAK